MVTYRPRGSEIAEISSSNDDRRPLIVAVEGNIGCGKSTFLNFCGEKPGIEVCPEPIGKWTNVDGVNLLVSEQRVTQSTSGVNDLSNHYRRSTMRIHGGGGCYSKCTLA